MKNLIFILIIVVLYFWGCKKSDQLKYPKTPKVNAEEDYFGYKVVDSYRWLEEDTSNAVEEWVGSQNEVTFSYLDQIPFRNAIQERIKELYNYERISSPRRVGDYYFFRKNDGLQNQSVLFRQKGLSGTPEVFIDPNKLSEKGTVSIGLLGESPDEKYIAYSKSEAGSDWRKIYIKEVESGEDLNDELDWVKFSGTAWYKDGFYYSRYPQPESGMEFSQSSEFQSVYYHKLGTDQAEDILIYEDRNHPNMYHNLSITEDKKYLILYKRSGTDGFEVYFKPTNLQKGGFSPLITGFEYKSSVIDHKDGEFYILTDYQAPKYRLAKANLSNPQPENWIDVIPEKEETLSSVRKGGGSLFASYLKDAFTRIYQYEYDGSGEKEIQLPAPGSAGLVGGKKDQTKLFYTFSSFTFPPSIYQYEIATGESSLFFQPSVSFNPSDFESRQVFYTSKDGTKVPMFVVHKRGLELDGSNPAYLYAYGGFNISLTPSFSSSNIVLLENGGVFAMANLRGGGEYGEEWHKAGMLEKKQNVFDDFIAAAEYLIDNGYTSSEKLAIAGGSNGGLLVGACMTQRPDLYKVAFPAVGVMDMLRYHKFTVGWGWIPEYGCADSSRDQFEFLYAYSPLHNLKPGTSYPATMVTTADHDDRVVPAHSFKFAATLQEYHDGEDPVLIRIQTDAGHGGGKPISKTIEEQTDKWSFMFYNMGEATIYQRPKG